jgi:hypothetical protein
LIGVASSEGRPRVDHSSWQGGGDRARGQASELGDLNRAITADKEWRVTDLAAERAMREPRDVAKGPIDDVRASNRISSRPCGNSLSSAAWLSIQLEVLSEFSEQGNPLKKDLSNTCIRQRLIY